MTNRYLIRTLTADDELFLWEMLYLAIYVPEGTPPPSRGILDEPQIAHYVQGWGRAGDVGVIGITQGDNVDVRQLANQPAGAAWLRYFGGTDKGYGYGYGYVADDIPELTMAILSEHRGKGLGTQLLRELIAVANGVAISLSVDPSNPALRLYKRFGFRAVGSSGTSLTMLREATPTNRSDQGAL